MSKNIANELIGAAMDAAFASDYERAVFLYTQAHEQDPTNVEPLFGRGSCQSVLGNDQAAFDDFDKVVQMDPGYLGARVERAKAAEISNQIDFARAEWDKLVKDEPDIPAVWSGRARFQSYWDGEHHAAMKDAFQALHLDDEWDEGYSVLLHTLLDLGRFDEAIKIAETALKKIEFPEYMYADYGMALFDARRYEDACEAFEKGLASALEGFPPADFTILLHAQALCRMGRNEEVLELLETLVDAKDIVGIVASVRARVLLRQGKLTDGLAELAVSEKKLRRGYASAVAGVLGFGDRYNMAWFHALRCSLTQQYNLTDFDTRADRARAIDILIKLIAVSPIDLNTAKASPEFDGFWDDRNLAEAAVVANAKLEKKI